MKLAFMLGVALLLVSCADNSGSETITPPPAGVEVGRQAPDFVLSDRRGAPVALSDFRGKVVLVDFWASWCGPCLAKLPALRRLDSEYADRGFVLFGVSQDYTREKWAAFIDTADVPWSHVYDERGVAAVTFDVSAIPTTFLIDRAGVVLARDPSDAQLRGMLDSLL